ncbi:MAG: MarR family transcriptional regulator, partial [Actinobacteria bacterium]|nr:MarR family transcriptional regulator [Actinomycetota bacterium]
MTRWLSIEEQAVWRSWLVATSMMRERLSQDQEEGSGFSVEEYGLLVQLSEAEGRRLRMSSLAALGLYSRSRLSHSISRLVDKGWVTKEPCDTDRRGAWAVLTKAGFEALEAAA